MADQSIVISEQGSFTVITGSGFGANETVNAQVNSYAVAPNESTEGITAGVHKVSDSNGDVTFRVLTDFLVPDTPRNVHVRMYTEQAEINKTF